MRIKRWLVFMMVVIGCVLAAFAEPTTKWPGLPQFRLFKFREVNPPDRVDIPFKRFLWTPRYSYHADERIPIYCETFYPPSVSLDSCSPTEEPFTDLLTDWLTPCVALAPAYRSWYGLDGKLVVRHEPFNKPIAVVLKTELGLQEREVMLRVYRKRLQKETDPEWRAYLRKYIQFWENYTDIPKYPREVLFPDPDKIPHYWLHGKPVKAKEFIGGGPWVDLYPGESFVRYAPNIKDFWVTRKGPDGRIYVMCLMAISDEEGKRVKVGYEKEIKALWLPIEGRYRVQYGTSNIIEFEIRQ